MLRLFTFLEILHKESLWLENNLESERDTKPFLNADTENGNLVIQYSWRTKIFRDKKIVSKLSELRFGVCMCAPNLGFLNNVLLYRWIETIDTIVSEPLPAKVGQNPQIEVGNQKEPENV